MPIINATSKEAHVARTDDSANAISYSSESGKRTVNFGATPVVFALIGAVISLFAAFLTVILVAN